MTTEDHYRAVMERTRQTALTPEQILVVLDWYIENARQTDDFAGYNALLGVRMAIMKAPDFDTLMAALMTPKTRRQSAPAD